MNLQIKQKLSLLVVVAMAALIGTGIFALVQASKLNSALGIAIQQHAALAQASDRARGAQVRFKTQVQEWKNILLRGKNEEAFNKHLKGFDEQEKLVKERLLQVKELAAKLAISDRLKIDNIISTFEKLGPNYRNALKQYDRNSADPAGTVDKLVSGMDREPTKLIDELVAEMQTVAKEFNVEEARKSDEIYSAVKTGLIAFTLGAMAVLAFLAVTFIRSITGPLDTLEKTMSEIASSGNLTRRAQIINQDEIGKMANAFNGLMGQLQKIIGEVLQASKLVASTSNQLASSSSTLADVSEQQSSAVAGSAAAIEQLTVAISAVSETANDVHHLSMDSVTRTNEGSQKVSHLAREIDHIQANMQEISRTVKEFVTSTQAITQMTREVRDIADQTNLLALNAAIEAARAGESGRGFAVVADEVRVLAEKSSKSASQIDVVTKSIMSQSTAVQAAIDLGEKSIATSAALANDVEGALEHSRNSVERSSQGVNDISGSVSEQKIASTEIAQSMERIANMVEENNAAANSVSSSTNDLRLLAQKLETSVSAFKVA
jgi:methyl-accepting chemotaxis protein